MGFVNTLRELSELVEILKSGASPSVTRGEYSSLAQGLVNVLSEGLSVVGSVVIDGKPYPPSELVENTVQSNLVKADWTAALNCTHQIIERSDDEGLTWDVLDDTLGSGVKQYTDGTVNPETSYVYRLRAVQEMSLPKSKKIIWDHNAFLGQAYPVDVVSGESAVTLTPCSLRGRVCSVGIYLEETGSDGTDALELEADVKINGVSVLNILPKITDDAADKSSTFIAGVGITQAEVKDNGEEYFGIGDLITIDLNLVRTTPETEMAGVMVIIDIEEGSEQYSEYSNALSVTTPAV